MLVYANAKSLRVFSAPSSQHIIVHGNSTYRVREQVTGHCAIQFVTETLQEENPMDSPVEEEDYSSKG